jgi:uncharacterized membrane protein YphA (DoxX/SURF4 family)
MSNPENFFVTKRTMRFLSILEFTTRCGVGLIFVYAAVPKMLDITVFSRTVDAFGLVPDFLVVAVAILLPVLEIVIAVGLFTKKKIAVYSGLGLLFLFIAVLCYAIWMGFDMDCGCFGSEDPEYTAFQGLKLALARDVVLALFLFFVLWFQRYQLIQQKY